MSATVTFHAPVRHKGSNMKFFNVDRDGKPFGQIWTFAGTKTESFGFHAKTVDGAYAFFDHADKKEAQHDAIEWMKNKAA